MKNKINWLMILVILVSSFGASLQTARAQGEKEPFQSREDVRYVPGEVIVTFERGFRNREQSFAAAQSVAQAVAGEVLAVRGNAFLMKVNESTDIRAFTTGLKENARSAVAGLEVGIASSQPNYIFEVPEPTGGDPGDVTPTTPRPNNERDEEDADEVKKRKTTTVLPTYPNDPLLFNTWGWWDASADVIWQDKAATSMVCVLDTGVDAAHPDLAGMVVNGKDFVNNDNVPDDDNGHGTHVAGVIAAKSNNKVGLAGISKGKILAVKVLDSTGSGNTWDIADGIRLCANNTAVKVINMSLGSYYPDPYMYESLAYAIIGKGKLVVTAAGNESTSAYLSFPAAWAAPFVCQDGSLAFPDCVDNFISHGLISVAASRSYWSDDYDGFNGGQVDGYLWVDTNGDNVENVTDDTNPAFWNEHFYMSQCAASYSNFGAWVNIVAPGENVTSTVPVSYPFQEQYAWGADPDGDGYDTWDGTSMAAPHVAAAAARLWSIAAKVFGTTAVTNADIKQRLIDTGYGVTTAVDPDQTLPYVGYGYDYIDPNFVYNEFAGEAPFCWPDASDDVINDTSGARILNLAGAMNRTNLYAYVYNSINGLPLKGAVVGAYSGTTLVSAGMLSSNTSPVVVLPNIPRDKVYDIKVSKPGFTSGLVTISSKLYIPGDIAYMSDPSISVSIPPIGKIDGVIDWVVYDPTQSDLDMYVWTPTESNPEGGGIVGCCLNTPSFVGNGRLTAWPFARWNLDGGAFFDWAGTESVTIMPKPGSTTIPYYNRTPNDFYDFVVYEYELGALNANQIYFRLWNGGKIKATVIKTPGENDCDPGERWWQPGFLWGSKFVYWNDTGSGLDPVAFGGGICGTGATYSNGGQWPYTIFGAFGRRLVR